jgi:phage gpG-like protein
LLNIVVNTTINKRRVAELVKQIRSCEENIDVVAGPRPDIRYGKKRVMEVVGILENGSLARRIPARPFLKITLANKSERYRSIYRRNVKNKLAVMDIAKRIGKALASDIRKTIKDFRTPDNALSTKRKKKYKGKVLIWRGRLLRSIDYRVIKRKKNFMWKYKKNVIGLIDQLRRFQYK